MMVAFISYPPCTRFYRSSLVVETPSPPPPVNSHVQFERETNTWALQQYYGGTKDTVSSGSNSSRAPGAAVEQSTQHRSGDFNTPHKKLPTPLLGAEENTPTCSLPSFYWHDSSRETK